MKIAKREIYSLTNYITAIALLLSPFVYNNSTQASDILVPLIAGFFIVICNLCTDWRFSFWKKISMHHRMMIDLAMSSLLIIFPKLISYEGYVFFIPYLWIGLIKLLFFIYSIELLDNEAIIASAQQKSTAFKSFMADTISVKKSMDKRGQSVH